MLLLVDDLDLRSGAVSRERALVLTENWQEIPKVGVWEKKAPGSLRGLI